MALPVPQAVETRVRSKWSRRLKLKGYAIIGFWLALMVGVSFWLDWDAFIYIMWMGGITAGARYLKVGRALENDASVELEDDKAKELEAEYQERIEMEGQREVAAGSLSVPVQHDVGGLSLSTGQGGLSVTERD